MSGAWDWLFSKPNGRNAPLSTDVLGTPTQRRPRREMGGNLPVLAPEAVQPDKLPFDQSMGWFIKALQPRGGQSAALQQLDTEAAVGVMEMLQGGVALGSFTLFGSSPGPSTAAGTFEQIGADPTVTNLAILSLTHNGGAAAGTVVIRILRPDGSSYTFANPSVAQAGVTASWATISGGIPYIIVPPNFRLVADFPATAAGESWFLNGLKITVPAGAKPW